MNIKKVSAWTSSIFKLNSTDIRISQFLPVLYSVKRVRWEIQKFSKVERAFHYIVDKFRIFMIIELQFLDYNDYSSSYFKKMCVLFSLDDYDSYNIFLWIWFIILYQLSWNCVILSRISLWLIINVYNIF